MQAKNGASKSRTGLRGAPPPVSLAALAMPLVRRPMERLPAALAPEAQSRLRRAQRDVVALGIIVAAILLFVGTGSQVMIATVRHLVFGEAGTDVMLTNALLLNIALIIFGWRRYTDLNREVEARRESEAMAIRLAATDPLTGCPNRRGLEAARVRLTCQAQANRGSLAMILIDLDRFKHSNDAHGHQAGDTVLIETARRIRALLPPEAVLARLGGDEFALLVPYGQAIDTRNAAEHLVGLIGGAIALPIHHGEHVVRVTASIGIALASGSELEGEGTDLAHLADVAMYQAKKLGRNRHCWFDPAMEADMLQRSRLEQAIRDGLKNGEFLPYYEKQVDIVSGAIIGFEMLARWHSPERGLVSPDGFLSVAEEIGLMPELSEALIRQALAEVHEWAPHLTLSINIAPVQLRDPWFAQRLLKLLVEARVPPSRIEIEFTEACLNENMSVVRSLVTSLRNQGVRISLDDFGNGYSSLAHLRTLPFDRIKIDRNFIAGLGNNPDSATIIEAITSMGRGMDLPITAEGIESPEILAELIKMGRFQGQGYVYGKPMSSADLRRELAEQHLLRNAPNAPAPATPGQRTA